MSSWRNLSRRKMTRVAEVVLAGVEDLEGEGVSFTSHLQTLEFIWCVNRIFLNLSMLLCEN